MFPFVLVDRHVVKVRGIVLGHIYPCQSASGDASRPVGVDLPVNHAEPSDDLRLKYFKPVNHAEPSDDLRLKYFKSV